jgi:TonB family protein
MRTKPIVLTGALAFASTLVIVVVLSAVNAAPVTPTQVESEVQSGERRGASEEELRLAAKAAASAADAQSMLRLARLQESRGALAEAETTLWKLNDLQPSTGRALQELAGLYHRSAQFERAVQTLEQAETVAPASAATPHLLATFLLERSKDPRVSATEQQNYLARGVAAEDRALAADPTFFEALAYKSLLLRELAARDPNPVSRRARIAEADALAARAASVRGDSSSSLAATGDSRLAPPPPPPVPGAGDIQWVYATTSYTASGNGAELDKVKDVRPVYPPMAIKFGVQGTVVVEAVVNRRGEVVDARVVDSVKMLDQSVIDAVKQWRFAPTTVKPPSDHILLTVTATFTPR